MTALLLARRFWWAPVIAGLLIWCLIQRTDLARKDAKLQHLTDVGQTTVARIEAGVARANAADLEHARQVGLAAERATKEVSDAYQAGLAARRDDYAQRLRDFQAAHSGSGTANLPAVPDPRRGFDGEACGTGLLCIPAEQAFALMKAADDNTAQLLSLQEWVAKQQAIPR